MFYHDGLRILDAEKARHSSKTRATPLIFIHTCVLISNIMLIFLWHIGAPTSSLGRTWKTLSIVHQTLVSVDTIILLRPPSIQSGCYEEKIYSYNQLEAVAESRQ